MMRSSYTHNQTEPSSTWVIQHSLNYKPVVQVYVMYEGIMEPIIPSITHNSENQITISFSQAFSGYARCV